MVLATVEPQLSDPTVCAFQLVLMCAYSYGKHEKANSTASIGVSALPVYIALWYTSMLLSLDRRAWSARERAHFRAYVRARA